MAAQLESSIRNIPEKQSNIWDIKGFLVDAKDVLGKGVFGIVYRATDSQGRKIAAKRIDIRDERKRAKITQDLENLKVLDHPNIVKVHEIHEEEEGFIWIFMDLCEHEDLNKFCMKTDLTQEQVLEIMVQILAGISYLHSKNVIHRDVKPENILVASSDPLHVKLTDFDVSKFLEECFDTSAMSTNVGTQAFKAPEFFKRTKEGKLRYHRNVDVFAAGLTGLALIQAKGKRKALIPHIETPQDYSESYHPVGSLIHMRIKYKVEDLRIVLVPDFKMDASIEDEMRCVIRRMTCVNPEERISAAEAHTALKFIQKVPEVLLQETMQIPHGLNTSAIMCLDDKDNILIRGGINKEKYIRVFHKTSGQLMKEIKGACDHSLDCHIFQDPAESTFIFESCTNCNVLRSYNTNTDEAQTIYANSGMRAACLGPDGTVLCIHRNGILTSLQWGIERRTFQASEKRLKLRNESVYVTRMCYMEPSTLIVFILLPQLCVSSFSLSDGSLLWEYTAQNDGITINPHAGICCSVNGLIFTVDMALTSLVVLNKFGKLHQCLKTSKILFGGLCWSNETSELSACTASNVTKYKVTYR